MRNFIGADSLAFLSVEGIYRAMGEKAAIRCAAIHRSLLHRRISDPADRPHGAGRLAAQLSLLAEAIKPG